MDLEIVHHAQSNYGSNIYEVIGIADGTALGDFIKELDEFHDRKNNHCSISVFDSEEASKHIFSSSFNINIPGRKDTDISNLSDEWLELPICCHRAVGFWGANDYFVYPYGKHTKLPIQETEN